MLKRIILFQWHDWKHIGWLFKNLVKQFLLGNFEESYDALMWIRVHLEYDSVKKD